MNPCPRVVGAERAEGDSEKQAAAWPADSGHARLPPIIPDASQSMLTTPGQT